MTVCGKGLGAVCGKGHNFFKWKCQNSTFKHRNPKQYVSVYVPMQEVNIHQKNLRLIQMISSMSENSLAYKFNFFVLRPVWWIYPPATEIDSCIRARSQKSCCKKEKLLVK